MGRPCSSSRLPKTRTTVLRLVGLNIGLRTKGMDCPGPELDVACCRRRTYAGRLGARALLRGTKVIGLSDRVELVELRNIPQGRTPTKDEIAMSAPVTIAAAYVVLGASEPFVAVSRSRDEMD